jgi:hypothetical protein
VSAVVRAAIATAASTVEGVNCTPYFRQSTKPGDGMVRFDRRVRDSSGFGWIVTWQVVVFLSQDLATAEKWMDAHVPGITEAVEEELVITQVTPEQLALDTGTVPVVVISGTRAE